MPPAGRVDRFVEACAQMMEANPDGVNYIFCNEMNNPREWPEGPPLTPEDFIKCYSALWERKPEGALLWPGAIDPYNPGWGDWRVVWPNILNSLPGADGIAIHAYTHGPSPSLILDDMRFGNAPLQGIHYNFRVIEELLEAVPSRFRSLPCVVTEANHLYRENGDIGWEHDADDWVEAAYEYARGRVSGVCLFRHNYDQWNYGQYSRILQALREV